MVEYCRHHDRVELKLGKCWACGETEGPTFPKPTSFKNRLLFMLAFIVVTNLLLILLVNLLS